MYILIQAEQDSTIHSPGQEWEPREVCCGVVVGEGAEEEDLVEAQHGREVETC